ncbi:MAG TPA: hypothetical protein VE360_18230 [Pyrinomonadaceae bacterium]|nr:hypothetical protein [Pyrinomonadaceae bacterium]
MAEQLAQVCLVAGPDLLNRDPCPGGEAAAEGSFVEPEFSLQQQVDDAARHAGAEPRAGVVYLLLERELGLDEGAIRRRLAAGARVSIEPAGEADGPNLRELLGHYRAALAEGQHHAEAEGVARLAEDWRERFVRIVPKK